MNKKLFAIILVLAMLVAVMSGCTSSSKPATEPEETQQTETAETPASEAPAQEETEAPAEEPAVEGEAPAEDAAPVEKVAGATDDYDPNYVNQPVSLPITAEDTYYTIWMPVAPFIAEFIDDMNEEITVINEMAKRTNMHFEWTTCHADVEEEKFNLMVVAGDYLDVIGTMHHYSTGIDGAIEDEVIIDLTDLIMEYCPNYWNAINRDESTFRQLKTTEGNMGVFAQLLKEAGTENMGNVVRQDWLDEAGLDRPNTLEELHNVLTVFKNEHNAYMYIQTSGFDESIGNTFNVGTGLFMLKDYDFVCTYDQPEFKDYVKTMAQWYSEGLFSEDFYNDTNVGEIRQEFANDMCGIVNTSASGISDIYDYCTIDGSNMRVTALPQMLANDGEPTKMGSPKNLIKNAAVWSISTNCDPSKYEALCKMVEYCFSDEGDLLTNWGLEGDAFVYDEEGNPQWTDKITNDPGGRPFIFTSSFYAGGVGSVYFPNVVDMSKTFYAFTDDEWEAMDIFKTSYATEGWYIPSWATMTLEENEEYANYQTEMETYTESMLLQFVCGELDIDANWDQFLDTVHSMNYDRMYEMQYEVYRRAVED